MFIYFLTNLSALVLQFQRRLLLDTCLKTSRYRKYLNCNTALKRTDVKAGREKAAAASDRRQKMTNLRRKVFELAIALVVASIARLIAK